MEEYLGPVTYTSTGSTMLDLALGGGWADRRMANIVGDKSSGKSLLAIEGFANFHMVHPKGTMRYGEAEAAFDSAYASQLGFPDTVEMLDEPMETVQQWGLDMEDFIDRCAKSGQPGMYILDSCDALSSDQEKARKIGDTATYGAEKPKFLSEFFRKKVRDFARANVKLLIISQVREDIGATYGDGLTRSGGKALDFYASQICWLKHKGVISKQVKGQQRAVGVSVGAKIKKNKTGFPFREADFDIMFGYGVDDEQSMVDWLETVGRNQAWGKNDQERKQYASSINKQLEAFRNSRDRAGILQLAVTLKQQCLSEWSEIERELAPTTSKYSTPAPVLAPIPAPIPRVMPVNPNTGVV